MFEEQFEKQETIYHSCDCYPDCKGQECPCFHARQQPCLKDSCCQTCIQMKNAIILADRGEYCTCKNTQCLKSYCKCFQSNGVCTSLCQCQGCQNKIDSRIRGQAMQALKNNPMFEAQRKYCTCKKIKCDKKYCSCFANGVKCSKFCSCETCNNCDQILNEMEEQRSPSFVKEEDLEQMPFPEKMSFQSIRFSRNSRNSRNSMNSWHSKNSRN